MSRILGLETSCDETSAAVVRGGHLVEANVVWSQDALHEQYAGVVPEIASRAHLERIYPVIEEALDRSGHTFERMDAIAVGNRPGLIGSLIVGVSAAQALAWSLQKPLIGVDHVQAHLWAPFLADKHPSAASAPPHGDADQSATDAAFPALGLVVSGGHTTLYELASPTDMRVLGQTNDDAVGEAYDKAAVMLDAGYPGGPAIDRLARQGEASRVDALPRSLLDRQSLDFSYSGLKTAMLYRVRGTPVGRGRDTHFERSASDLTDDQRADLAAAFQHAAISTLISKCQRALDHLIGMEKPARSLIIGGGVSANSSLRESAAQLASHYDLTLRIPALDYCMDNAAMIAGLAHHHLAMGNLSPLDLPAIPTTAV